VERGWGVKLGGRSLGSAGGAVVLLTTAGTEAASPARRAPRGEPPAPTHPPTLTSALKVPMVESYLSRWEACLTPPESLTATTSRLELAPRPSQQRRNWRPMRPKPLMATRIFLADTVTCLLPAADCRGGGGRRAGGALARRGLAAAAAARRWR
jgi:hypothetical protein